MLDLTQIIKASEAEILASEKDAKGVRLSNLIKEGDVYRTLSKKKIEGEFLFSAPGMDDQAVSIEWGEGICFITGLSLDIEIIPYATIHKDEAALLRAMHGKLESLKAGEEIIKNPFFMVGPPGTGKTKTISQMVAEFLALGRRVLVVSPTHMAVEGVFDNLDFTAMGLSHGDAILSARTDKQSLMRLAPAEVAKIKMQPINDELEMLESAMEEILSAKRNADALLEAHAQESEAVNLTLSSLRNDEITTKRVLVRAHDELDAAQGRMNLLQANTLVKSVAGAFMGNKIAEIENDINSANAMIKAANVRLESIAEKQNDVLKSIDEARTQLLEAQNKAKEALEVKKQVENRIVELKKQRANLHEMNLFKDAKLVGCTITAAALNKKISDAEFDVIIVDELSMASLPPLVCACKSVKMTTDTWKKGEKVYNIKHLYQAQQDAVNAAMASQFIFVGDPKQLSPIAKTAEIRKTLFDVYGIEKIFDGEAVENAVLLDINFRNHPQITALASRLFYGGKLKSGRIEDGSKALFIQNCKGSMSQTKSNSYMNMTNAVVTTKWIQSALRRGHREVGAIAPYNGQTGKINDLLQDSYLQYADHEVETGTIHKFQGKEKKIILFDLTASSGVSLPKTFQGDMNSEAAKLLNVATTRAKDFFVLVGDVDGLEKQLRHTPGHEQMVLFQWIVAMKELAYN